MKVSRFFLVFVFFSLFFCIFPQTVLFPDTNGKVNLFILHETTSDVDGDDYGRCILQCQSSNFTLSTISNYSNICLIVTQDDAFIKRANLYFRSVDGNDYQVRFGLMEEDGNWWFDSDWHYRYYIDNTLIGEKEAGNTNSTYNYSDYHPKNELESTFKGILEFHNNLSFEMSDKGSIIVYAKKDNSGPVISTVAANNDPLNQTFNNQILLRDNVPLFFNFSDLLSGFRRIEKAYIDGTELTSAQASWTYSTSNPSQLFIQQNYLDTLTEGAHNVRLVAIDNVGNQTDMAYPIYYTKLQMNLVLANAYIDDLGTINANYPNVKTVKAVDSTLDYSTTFSDVLLATASNYTGYKIMALPPNTTNMIELTSSLIRNSTTVLSEKAESTFGINKAALEEGVWQFQVVSAFMVNGIGYLGYPSMPIKVLIKNSGTTWGISNLHENTQTLLMNWDYNTENAGSKEFLNGFKVIIKRQEAIAPIETDWNAPNLFRDSFYDLTPLKTKIPLKLFLRAYDIFGNMNETIYNFTLPNRSYAISKTGANNLYVQGPGVETPTQTYSDDIPEIKLNKIYDDGKIFDIDGDELKFKFFYRKSGNTSFIPYPVNADSYVSSVDLNDDKLFTLESGAYEWYVKIGEFYDEDGLSSNGNEKRLLTSNRTIPIIGNYFSFSYASLKPKSPMVNLSEPDMTTGSESVSLSISGFQPIASLSATNAIKYLYVRNNNGTSTIPASFIDLTTGGSSDSIVSFSLEGQQSIITNIRNGSWVRIEVSNYNTATINLTHWPIANSGTGFLPIAVFSEDLNEKVSKESQVSVSLDSSGQFLTFNSLTRPFILPSFSIPYQLLSTVQGLQFELYKVGEPGIINTQISDNQNLIANGYTYTYSFDNNDGNGYGLYRLSVTVTTLDNVTHSSLDIVFDYDTPSVIQDIDANDPDSGLFTTTIGVPVKINPLGVEQVRGYNIAKWTWSLDAVNDDSTTLPSAMAHRSGEYNYAEGAIIIDLDEIINAPIEEDGMAYTIYSGVLNAIDEFGMISKPYSITVYVMPTSSGVLIENERWNGKHEITSALEVPANVTLTIQPSAEITVSASKDQKILINGNLIIESGARIDGPSIVDEDFYWYGFFISDTGSATVGDAIISGAYRAFVLNGGELTLSWTNIKENFIGLHLLSGSIAATNCDISSNEVYGVKIEDLDLMTIDFDACNIMGNEYNFFVEDDFDILPSGSASYEYIHE